MNLKPVLAGFPGRKAICDTETYPNYILLSFEDVDTGEIARFHIDETRDEHQAASDYFKTLAVIVTYNGHGFDDHVLDLAFKGVDAHTIWQYADGIIRSSQRRYSPFLTRRGDAKPGYPLSIDLAQILRKTVGGKGGKSKSIFPGLKTLGNRFGYQHLQTLPIKPGTVLDAEQKVVIADYNNHDLAITRLVLKHLNAALEMRRVLGQQYEVSLTSRADAKLAEMIVATAYTKAMNAKLREGPHDEEPVFRLEPPHKSEWVCCGSDILSPRHQFTDPNLLALVKMIKGWTLHWRRTVDKNGDTTMHTPNFGVKVKLADKTYSVGLGGLHSEDDPLVIDADDIHAITDIDVASYYPGLVIKERITPGHLDPDIYCGVFEGLMQARLKAKANKQKEIAQGMKVAINSGGYGKLSDKYSPFRDPPKGAQVTINGQLILLRLIEELLRIDGVRVLSANTDGVLLHHPRAATDQIAAAMETVRGIYDLNKFEVVEVLRLCRVANNEYVMKYRDPDTGEVMIKGRGQAFNDGTEAADLGKKTDNRIIKHAAIQHLMFDRPIEQTVRECQELPMFIGYATLDDCWTHIEDTEGNKLPQNTNRWYEATNGTVLYRVNAAGKKHRFSEMQGIVVVNDLPGELPTDINYDYYIGKAQTTVDGILNPKQKQSSRVKKIDTLSDEERLEWDDRLNAAEVNVDWLNSLDLNHYRDNYLGKYRNNNYYDSMIGVLAALWHKREFHMTKADLLWCFASFDTSECYFQRPDKRKSMLRYIDKLVERVPFEKEVLPDDDVPISLKVNVLNSEPGAGKTRKALQMVVSKGPNIYWWAINKIQPLAGERQTELMALAHAKGVTVDFLPIHSDAKGSGTMRMRIDKRMQEINSHPHKSETIFVTIITHKTLIDNYLGNVCGTLLVDEPVEVWQQQHFQFPSSYRTIRGVVEPRELPTEYDSDINAAVNADTQAIRLVITEEGREQLADEAKATDTILKSYRWILEQAAKTSGRVFTMADQWNDMDNPKGPGLDVLALLHPQHVVHFDEVWMMAAHFKELIIYQLWNRFVRCRVELGRDRRWLATYRAA